MVGTQTLTPGGSPITTFGTTVSLGLGVTEVIVDGTSTTKLGNTVKSSVGSTVGAPPQYTGGAVKLGEPRGTTGVWMVVFAALLFFVFT